MIARTKQTRAHSCMVKPVRWAGVHESHPPGTPGGDMRKRPSLKAEPEAWSWFSEEGTASNGSVRLTGGR